MALWMESQVRAMLEALEPRPVSRRPETRYAAVAVVLRYPAPDAPEVLIIRRTEHPGDPWSGHLAFPGGREEDDDPTLLDTAVRETWEEVGLDLRATATHLGRLHDVQAVARARRIDLVIVPFVFVLRADAPLRPDGEEVAATYWAPLAPMAAGEVDAVRPYEHEGRKLDLPAFRLEDRLIWGLTHRMLDTFFDELRRHDRTGGDDPGDGSC